MRGHGVGYRGRPRGKDGLAMSGSSGSPTSSFALRRRARPSEPRFSPSSWSDWSLCEKRIAASPAASLARRRRRASRANRARTASFAIPVRPRSAFTSCAVLTIRPTDRFIGIERWEPRETADSALHDLNELRRLKNEGSGPPSEDGEMTDSIAESRMRCAEASSEFLGRQISRLSAQFPIRLGRTATCPPRLHLPPLPSRRALRQVRPPPPHRLGRTAWRALADAEPAPLRLAHCQQHPQGAARSRARPSPERRSAGCTARTVARTGEGRLDVRSLQHLVCAGVDLLTAPLILHLVVMLLPVSRTLLHCTLVPARDFGVRGRKPNHFTRDSQGKSRWISSFQRGVNPWHTPPSCEEKHFYGGEVTWGIFTACGRGPRTP